MTTLDSNEKSQANLLQNVEEATEVSCEIKGKVPLWLNGNIIRNGAGQFDVGKDTYNHWFDGHAFLHKFDICNGHVTYSGKFIQSETYKKNNKYNQIVIGSLGTPSIPDPCKNFFQRFFARYFSKPPRHDNCNVNVSNLGNSYYALTDTGIAGRFDSDSLDTKYFIGQGSKLEEYGATAHPHYDPNGDYLNVGINFKKGYYNITRVPAKSMVKDDPMEDIEIFSRIEIDDKMHPSYFHSFALSDNYIALHDQTVRLNVYKLIRLSFSWGALLDPFDYDSKRESVFHVVDKRSQQKLPTRYVAEGRSCFHHINSYEEKVGDRSFLIIDLFCHKGPLFTQLFLKMLRENTIDQSSLPMMLPHRYVLPLDVDQNTPKDTNLVESFGSQATAMLRDDGSIFLTPEILLPDDYEAKTGCVSFELPSINHELCNGKKYKFVYCTANKRTLPDQLAKINVETKEIIQWKEENYYPSEPVFVRRPNSTEEDDGVVLATVISDRLKDPVFLVILDAKSFQEIARAEIQIKLSYPFHGYFTKQKDV